MQQVLFSPVFQKANEAIEKVAKEQGFAFIFDLSAGGVIYYDANISVDVPMLAKTALGIPAEKVAPSQLPWHGAIETVFYERRSHWSSGFRH